MNVDDITHFVFLNPLKAEIAVRVGILLLDKLIYAKIFIRLHSIHRRHQIVQKYEVFEIIENQELLTKDPGIWNT